MLTAPVFNLNIVKWVFIVGRDCIGLVADNKPTVASLSREWLIIGY